MTFDFSHLLQKETVTVHNRNGDAVFDVTVREITHGERASAQGAMFQGIDVRELSQSKEQNQRAIQNAMQHAMQNGNIMLTAAHEEFAAIDSWTLKDANGDDVPVTFEAWQALPVWITSQIVPIIERLNPETSEESKS